MLIRTSGTRGLQVSATDLYPGLHHAKERRLGLTSDAHRSIKLRKDAMVDTLIAAVNEDFDLTGEAASLSGFGRRAKIKGRTALPLAPWVSSRHPPAYAPKRSSQVNRVLPVNAVGHYQFFSIHSGRRAARMATPSIDPRDRSGPRSRALH